MHIMLFGGAFDPPHNGHLQIAHAIIEQKIADQLWVIPCATHPFGKNMSPAQDRLVMLQLAKSLIVNTYEIDKSTVSYTIDTIEHFAKIRPNDTFSWLIGSDQLPSFTRWHRWQDLTTSFTVFVYPRQDFPVERLHEGMIALKQLPLITISSTLIRSLAHSRATIDHLTTPAITQYITENNLYA